MKGLCVPLLLMVATATWVPLGAQVVPVKSVPVASGDQFLFHPSRRLAMGEAGLALADTLGDPFTNPATGARLQGSLFFASPTYYGISNRNGSARTLPLGVLFTAGRWFGGGSLSLQEVKGAERGNQWRWIGPEPLVLRDSFLPWEPLAEASTRNLYAFGLLGYRFPDKGLSIGVSAFHASLGALDGVDLLYAMSQEIEQSGRLSDLRVGAIKEWDDGRALEFLILRNEVRVRHDVTYLDMVWEPVLPDTFPVMQLRSRVEKNLDHTDTWGAHLAYSRPLTREGWSMGWSVTANRKDHPKIPNYEIQNIPRDPGESWAFSAGGGIAVEDGPVSFAADLFLEPIRSETWADAAADTVSATGTPIPGGERTVENEFRFLNALIRTGGSYRYRWATLMLGVQIRSISYELQQDDHLQETRRDQTESWMEWSPSVGASLELGGAVLRYTARTTTGTGRPGVQWTPAREAAFDLASDFILAPQGPLTLQEAKVTTHQLSVVIPIR